MRVFPSVSRPVPLALAILFSMGAPAVLAQAPSGGALAGPAVPIDIAAQPLAQALNSWARQTGTPIVVQQQLVQGRTAPAVAGRLTPQQAIDRLLQGSGLIAVPEGAAVVVRPAPTDSKDGALSPVVVRASGGSRASELPEAFAGGQVASGARLGLLGNVGLLETPFNVTSYTAELMANQQARNIVDVLANDPSSQAGGPRSFDNFYIRGFPLHREEIGFDGLYGIASAEGNLLEGIERVEVLKGPSTLLNGSAPRGTAGGAINLVPKRAGDAPLTRFTASYLSDGNVGGHLDIGRRFGPDQAAGLRINAAARDGRVSADHEAVRSHNVTVGLDWRSARTRLSADFGSSAERLDGARSNFYVSSPTLPAAPSGDTNVWPSWTFQDKTNHFGVLRGEFDLTPELTATLAYGKVVSRRRMLEAFSELADSSGTLFASGFGFNERTERQSAEANLRWRGRTGSVSHQAVVALSHYGSDIAQYQPTIPISFTSNLYQPIDPAPPVGVDLDGPRVKQSKTRMDSVALTDTLGLFDERLLLTLGLRHQKIAVDSHNFATGVLQSRYERSETTPAAAVVYRPSEQLSFYANYVEALSQGPTAPATAPVNPNEVFPPIKTKQGEVGIKVDWGRLATTLSAFQITRPSGLLDATGRYSVDGEQRNRGMELQLFGELQSTWRVLGGVTWTQGRLTRTQGGLNDGRQAAGVPRWLVKLGTEWDVPGLQGLTLTGRVIHTSSQALTVDGATRLPSWTRLDLGARYTTRIADRPVTLRASVENAANRRYWDSVPAFQVVTYAQGRAVLLSATVDF